MLALRGTDLHPSFPAVPLTCSSSATMAAMFRGKLLVGTPALTDPNFDRTVVLLLEHSTEGGALGIVLNRPTATPIVDAIPDWAMLATAPAVVYLGGPVGVGTIIAMARARTDDPPAGTEPVSDHLVAVDLALDPEPLAPVVSALRVWTGYAGWAPGQLEEEVAQDAWFVVDADDSDVMTPEPNGLWRSVLARQPGTLGWFANFPEDPAHN
jgi:putative transcriptional regulator